jgi:hypothetical protein
MDDFTFCRIPIIGQGFQNTHIKGTKAMLALLPFSNKGIEIQVAP